MGRLNHEAALDAICHTGVVLSYQEAIEGYLALRGLKSNSPPSPAPIEEAQPCDCDECLESVISVLSDPGDEIVERVADPLFVRTPAEIQSGYNRLQWAEGLISQLPADHDGRNSWLLNYGRGEEAVRKQKARGLVWNKHHRAALSAISGGG